MRDCLQELAAKQALLLFSQIANLITAYDTMMFNLYNEDNQETLAQQPEKMSAAEPRAIKKQPCKNLQCLVSLIYSKLDDFY